MAVIFMCLSNPTSLLLYQITIPCSPAGTAAPEGRGDICGLQWVGRSENSITIFHFWLIFSEGILLNHICYRLSL